MKVKRATIHAYWLMFIASVITVGIVTSSQLITDRISLLLDRQASELLAADLVWSRATSSVRSIVSRRCVRACRSATVPACAAPYSSMTSRA